MSNVNFIFIQIFGMTATVFLCVSYMVKSKKKFLFLGLLGDIIYGLTFIFVNSWGAGIITLLSCCQFVFVLIYLNKQKQLPKFIAFLFVTLFLIVGCVTLSNVWDIIPMIIYCFYTMALYYEDIKKIKLVYLVSNLLLVVYDIMVMAYANAFEDCVESICLFNVVFIDFIKSKKIFRGEIISATLKKFILLHGTKTFGFCLQSSSVEVKTSNNHNFNNSLKHASSTNQCLVYKYG